MQMKTAIAELGLGRALQVALPMRSRVVEAAETIAHPPTDVTITKPDDLDVIAARVTAAFEVGKLPALSDLRHAPWCLWAGQRPISSNATVLERFLDHIRSSGKKSAFSRLASVYVVAFPTSQPSLKSIATTLKELAHRFAGPWSLAAKELAVFDPDEAPRRIAEIALRNGSSPSRVLAQCGIDNLAAEAGLAEAAFLAGIDQLARDQTLSGMERLDRVINWGVRRDGRLLFEQHRGKLADALVLPYANQTPAKQVRDRYLGFLVANFDDPRLSPGRWVQMRSTAIVRRWLTEQSLRQFLDVVGRVAYSYQWQYRRAFWEAVHRKGLISEAWVIFDNEGASIANQLFETDTPFARWASKPAVKGQACLLLKIGRGIVAEWSHDGRCHVWHDERDPSAPRIHDDRYQKGEVRIPAGSNHEFERRAITHNNSNLYYWQNKIADEVAVLTGKRIFESEFRI
jgi:hypothetical protein